MNCLRVLVVGPSVTARNVDELVALAKRKPSALTYGRYRGLRRA